MGMICGVYVFKCLSICPRSRLSLQLFNTPGSTVDGNLVLNPFIVFVTFDVRSV